MTFASRREIDLAGLDEVDDVRRIADVRPARCWMPHASCSPEGQTPSVEEEAELMRWTALSLLRAAPAEHDG